jgi:hypothetical protein
MWQRWRAWRADLRRDREAPPDAGAQPGGGARVPGLGRYGVWLAFAALAALLVGADLRRRARRRGALPAFYARALRLLARRGLRRAPETPARAFAREAEGALPPPAARAFAALTEAYLAERFGGLPARDAGAQLAALRAGLRGA